MPTLLSKPLHFFHLLCIEHLNLRWKLIPSVWWPRIFDMLYMRVSAFLEASLPSTVYMYMYFILNCFYITRPTCDLRWVYIFCFLRLRIGRGKRAKWILHWGIRWMLHLGVMGATLYSAFKRNIYIYISIRCSNNKSKVRWHITNIDRIEDSHSSAVLKTLSARMQTSVYH